MIADVTITEKSFGPKQLMTGVKFSVDDGEKVGIIGRNGIGKSTLFGILAGSDHDYTGEVIYRRGTTVVATAQEHHGHEDEAVVAYVLAGLPEYARLHRIITTYPETMGDDLRLISEYTEALERFDQKGFYRIEEQVERELENFQILGAGQRTLGELSGGQKRLVEIVKIMHADAHLALIDEPTNHMDYVAKAQFIDWMKSAREAMLVVTHDRDVLREVDRIIELKDGSALSFKGNYDAYLKQNAVTTGTAMNEFEMIEKRIINLKAKVLDYQRLKEKARNQATIQKFKRLEQESRKELAELETKERPTFWIDKDSVEDLHYKVAGQYQKFKARNIRMTIGSGESRSKHVLVSVKDLALGYGEASLFEGVTFDLREGEALELRGRNGAGKSTLLKALLAAHVAPPDLRHTRPRHAEPAGSSLRSAELGGRLKQSSPGQERPADSPGTPRNAAASGGATLINGSLFLDPHVRVGIYEQEVSERYFDLPLGAAIERMYLGRGLAISETKIRQLMADYLFTESDAQVPLSRLSGGQKARFQIITMLANDPQLLILDEPTNHLDLPSIEELETALGKYAGAILYVSHDGYFREAIGGGVQEIPSR